MTKEKDEWEIHFNDFVKLKSGFYQNAIGQVKEESSSFLSGYLVGFYINGKYFNKSLNKKELEPATREEWKIYMTEHERNSTYILNTMDTLYIKTGISRAIMVVENTDMGKTLVTPEHLENMKKVLKFFEKSGVLVK